MTHIFEYYAPKDQIKGVLSIPHSGELIAPEFKDLLVNDTLLLRKDVDYKVHELIDINALNNAGIAIIKANYSRVCVDLNRAKEVALLNWKKNSHGEQIVLHEPGKEVAKKLIQRYYTPYFSKLKELIGMLLETMEIASFIDLHSMPSKPTAYHFEQNPQQKSERPDFCLSDNHGKTCESKFIKTIQDSLNKDYAEVWLNDPYIGGYITTFADSIDNVNNIQIEINRGIYMDEKKYQLTEDKVIKLKPILTKSLINTFKLFYEKYKI